MRSRTSRRLGLESLDDRLVPASPASGFLQTNLVADQPGVAALTDPNLVNAWGIAVGNPGPTMWVSANGTDVTTVYSGDVAGKPFTINPLVVSIPGGAPTGQVFNGTPDFVVSNGTASGPALFIFASESGQISGWNPGVPPPAPSMASQPAFTSPDEAVYKGIAIGNNSTGNFLYAADFQHNKIDVLDKTFALTKLDGAFVDPNLPDEYAPFNIQNLGGKLYVAYAQQGEEEEDGVTEEETGPAKGLIDVFDTEGHFLNRLVSHGRLNAPWGLALAPAGFGNLGGNLLVGNFGDGRINAYDPTTGAFKGQLRDPAGKTVVIDGLWGLAFGNGKTAGDANTLYFAAGPDDETHGLLGSLKAVPATHPPARLEVVGADAGGGPRVRAFDAATGAAKLDFFAFEPRFTGGVRVAQGDVTGDGVPDIVTAAGSGGGPRVTVFDGATGAAVRTFFAFEPTFTGGTQVAAGDVDGDGLADIITGAGVGGAPRVVVFSGKDGSVLRSFFAYDSSFRNGVSVGAGDVDGDGLAEVVAGAGAGGGPAVSVFDGTTGQSLSAFFAFASSARGGVNVAAGDLDGDGKCEVIAIPAAGGSAVGVFDSAGKQRSTFAAFDPAFTGGARVAATDLDGDGKADILLGPGAGGGPDVRVRGEGGEERGRGLFAFEPTFHGGVYVA